MTFYTLFSDYFVIFVLVTPRIRTIGKKERSDEWWDRDVLRTYDKDQWLQDFRMDIQTFFKLVDFVREEMDVVATSAEYRAVGKGFGVAKSTVCVYVHEFCKTLIATQIRSLLSWPNHEECIIISNSFENKYGLPNIIGVIDGTHIPIAPPKDGAADFHNRKGYSSFVVQAVVDDKLLFRDITAQHPGCTHDAAVLRDSHLYHNHDKMIPRTERLIDGVYNADESRYFHLPYYIISDPAYPLSNWIMKDYVNEQTDEEVSFNLYLNKARIVVEHAFGRLKGRWRILYKKSDLDVYKMPHVSKLPTVRDTRSGSVNIGERHLKRSGDTKLTVLHNSPNT
ncbi:uncharacterized protein [Prorops nasuta]|uniref:uncharacterized protein n=1 Tax=Prorops nasuta TaxID=863751 RepID=UPI0034CE235C